VVASLPATEPSESTASEESRFIYSDFHGDEVEGKAREWPGCSDTMLGGVIEPWPSTGDDGDGEAIWYSRFIVDIQIYHAS
jgi:hypothetical protein